MSARGVSAARALVLWDVDHTLIDGGPVGKEIYRRAFEVLTGSAPRTPPSTDGRTDLAIMTDYLRAHRAPATSLRPDRVFEALARAGQALLPRLVAHGRALPGAAQCLAALRAEPGVVQSVLTGNIEPNARLKLAAFALDDHLDFAAGGYGSDGLARAALVPAAQRRARQRYGFDPDVRPTLLIGDTPRDVEAGRQAGTRVLGVCTGEFDRQALAGAEEVLPSLADPATVLGSIRRLIG